MAKKKPPPKPVPKKPVTRPVESPVPLPPISEKRYKSLLIQLGASRRNLRDLELELLSLLGRNGHGDLIVAAFAKSLHDFELVEGALIALAYRAFPKIALPATEAAWHASAS